MVRLGYGYRSARSQSQSQVPVDGRQYLDEVRSPVAVQPFQLPHEKEAVAAVTVIAEVLHLVHAAVSSYSGLRKFLPMRQLPGR